MLVPVRIYYNAVHARAHISYRSFEHQTNLDIQNGHHRLVVQKTYGPNVYHFGHAILSSDFSLPRWLTFLLIASYEGDLIR